MKIFHKCYVGLTSIWKVLYLKICTGGKLQMSWINSIKGTFIPEIMGNSSITIGDFLMSKGPLYLKSIDGGKMTIGKKVFFNHNCSITCAEKISIGNYCMFANNLVIVDHDHVMAQDGVTEMLNTSPIVIEDRVWCGANVTITKGVHIGTGAVIGANAVVVNDVEAHTVVGGVPAKRLK